MLKLNRTVVASLFFDARISPREMPSRIDEIFRWTGDEVPKSSVSMVLRGEAVLRFGPGAKVQTVKEKQGS